MTSRHSADDGLVLHELLSARSKSQQQKKQDRAWPFVNAAQSKAAGRDMSKQLDDCLRPAIIIHKLDMHSGHC